MRDVVRKRLRKGRVEAMDFGMICHFVPFECFPETYNAGLAAQKNYNAMYLMASMGMLRTRRSSRRYEEKGVA